MSSLYHSALAAVALAATVVATASPVSAACTRLGFSVNDYGKEGPTKDAKDLLDKYIAKTMAEKGVKTYRTGKKDVKCELYIDLIVFDEYTCRAEATVCWGGSIPSDQSAGDADAQVKPAVQKTTTGSIEKPAEVKSEPVVEPAAAAVSPPPSDPVAQDAVKTEEAAAPAQAVAPTLADDVPSAPSTEPASETEVAPVAPDASAP
ncbi:MAG: hypothetical protein CTY31_01010 [Hyphomicrobium sp.]|nr:MAG: hypothetical protein CTY39_06130 [Hyphomicrobium sp.]PPD01393.1 MAG: hypothetical protein CTY31_01010 [Hyphomicrobium sp.]